MLTPVLSNVAPPNIAPPNVASPHVASFHQYSLDDGLSQVTIYDIAEDPQGFIWLGTQRGVDRFDGYDFINLGDSVLGENELQRAVVLDIEVHPLTEDTWFATRVGLHVLRAKTGSLDPKGVYPSSEDNEVMALEFDEAGNAWIGTKRGVYVIYNGTDQVIPIWTQEKAISVDDLRVSPQNILWVSTSLGLKRYDIANKAWLPSMLDNETPTTIMFRGSSEIWVGTMGNGVFVFNHNTTKQANLITQLTMESGLANAIINDIKQDNQGRVWVATTNGVSIILRAEQATDMPQNAKLEQNKPAPRYRIIGLNELSEAAKQANIVNAVSIHHHHNGEQTFIGSFNRGVFVLNTKAPLFSKLDMPEGVVPYSVAIEDDNNIWISADNGLYRSNEKGQVFGPIIEKVSADKVAVANVLQDVFYSPTHKQVFLGSRMGLRVLDKPSNSIQAVSAISDLVYSITEAQNGLLLVGTRNAGLFLYDPAIEQTIMHWETPLPFTAHLVNESEVLVPTTNGLYIINISTGISQVFKHDENDAKSLAYNVVTWVSHYKDNQYFVGTQSKGLQLMTYDSVGTNVSFEQLFPHSKLSTLSIGAVLKDDTHNYWVTTTEGIARFNHDLNRITYFGGSDGANGSGYFIGASEVDAKGQFYFAGPEGVTVFHPNRVIEAASKPKLQFTNIKTLDNKQDKVNEDPFPVIANVEQEKLVLTPDNILFSVEFAALEFDSPDKIEYAYMLEGFHSQWQNTDSAMRAATFTNLAPGNYVFKVKASNRYQEWSDEYIRFDVAVLAPWWRTPIAIGCWVFITMITLFLLYKWRTYAIYQREEKLTQLVAVKTKDLEVANEKLKQLSILDPLTQTLNRRGFVEYAQREMSKFRRDKQRFCIILLDIDFFKLINDKHGHELGDKILVQIADVIQARLRGIDIMARWGGEEFIILLPSTPLEDAYLVASELKQAVASNRYKAVDDSIVVTFSAGVCEIEADQTLDQCIKRADEFLYKAKNNGRNLVCCR